MIHAWSKGPPQPTSFCSYHSNASHEDHLPFFRLNNNFSLPVDRHGLIASLYTEMIIWRLLEQSPASSISFKLFIQPIPENWRKTPSIPASTTFVAASPFHPYAFNQAFRTSESFRQEQRKASTARCLRVRTTAWTKKPQLVEITS